MKASSKSTFPGVAKPCVLVMALITISAIGTVAQTNTFPGSGNVGIGTTSPGANLDVTTGSTGDVISRVWNNNTSGSGTATFRIANSGSQAQGSRLQFSDNNYYLATITGDRTNGLTFRTGTTAGSEASLADRMTILPGGNVGVGTSTPKARIDLRESDDSFMGGLHLRRSSTNDTWALVTGADNSLYMGYADSASGADAHSDFTVYPLVLTAAGNVGIGTPSPGFKLDVNGNTNVTGNVTVSGTGNITATGTIEGGNIKAKYQDVAEWVPSAEELPAGTVVVLDTTKSNQVISSTTAYDTRVAGVVSAQPGITLGEGGQGKALVATTGRVRVKVDASRSPINIGDLLVTSDLSGVAMKSEAVNLGGVQIHRPGTIIGKALEPLAKGQGEILVLLSLQ
jgi:hypothetical protein